MEETQNKGIKETKDESRPAKQPTRFPEGAKKGERHWYAVHTYSGYEDAVARYLNQRVDSLAMNDKIFNVIVPKEKKVRIKNGKRKTIEEKIYPGYVLVDMIMKEDSWYVVRNTPRVTGFVGADTTEPTPLSKEEVESLMVRMKGDDETGFKLDFAVGDLVKIVDGPFKDYDGKVSGIDEEHGKIKVMVPIFGRDTAVELDSLQVQKV
ncbi:MAG: transcription termination/antitermination protein NusG [Candidatus Wolfebacteria bacterium]|nr:transcription termination/antitermination protein NusG [Candidatus Wolfebacteria bacterium]